MSRISRTGIFSRSASQKSNIRSVFSLSAFIGGLLSILVQPGKPQHPLDDSANLVRGRHRLPLGDVFLGHLRLNKSLSEHEPLTLDLGQFAVVELENLTPSQTTNLHSPDTGNLDVLDRETLCEQLSLDVHRPNVLSQLPEPGCVIVTSPSICISQAQVIMSATGTVSSYEVTTASKAFSAPSRPAGR